MSMSVADIITLVKNSTTSQKKNIKKLEKLCKELGRDSFLEDFVRCLLIVFITDHKTKNIQFERCFDFSIQFVLHMNDIDLNSEELCFFDTVIDNLLQYLQVNTESIRYNICKFLGALIAKHEVPHDDSIIVKVIEALLARVTDIRYTVRLKAVQVLQYLQIPQDPNNAVVKVFIKHLCDKNAKVRAEIVQCICVTNETIPVLIHRSQDIDEHVRLATFKKFASISVEMLQIEQRQTVLKRGFNDHSERVKTSVTQLLLPSWLEVYENDYVKLIKALQLDANEEEIKNSQAVSEEALNLLFYSRPIREILEMLHLVDKLIPVEQLTWELAIYWNALVRYIRNQQHLGEYLEMILPETVEFCAYIEQFCASSPLRNGTVWEQTHHTQILHQLVRIAVECDISDQASRLQLNQRLITVLKQMQLSRDTVALIVRYLALIVPTADAHMDYVCEIVSDIRSPLVSSSSQLEMTDDGQNKLAELKDQLYNLMEAQRGAIEVNEFLKAADLKELIATVKEQIADATRTTNSEQHCANSNDLHDTETVTRCLVIIEVMLQSRAANTMTSSMRTLKDTLFKEMGQVEDVELRCRYLKCYATLCSFEETSAKENIQFLCVPLMLYKSKSYCDQSTVLTAVAAVVDYVLLYGPSVLLCGAEESDGQESDVSADFEERFKTEITLMDVVEVLSTMMDDEDSALREISGEALVKLLSTNRIQSAMLVSRVILKWFNPHTANDVRLRQLLGAFLENFHNTPGYEQQLEEAFVPTIRAICLAPDTSPLADVSKSNVLKFLVHITDLQMNTNYNIHKNLAMTLCNEILKDVDTGFNVVCAKALLMLNLPKNENDDTYVEELLNLCEYIRTDSTDKKVLTCIIRFINFLKYEEE